MEVLWSSQIKSRFMEDERTRKLRLDVLNLSFYKIRAWVNVPILNTLTRIDSYAFRGQVDQGFNMRFKMGVKVDIFPSASMFWCFCLLENLLTSLNLFLNDICDKIPINGYWTMYSTSKASRYAFANTIESVYCSSEYNDRFQKLPHLVFHVWG